MSAVVVGSILVMLGAIGFGVAGELRAHIDELQRAHERATCRAAARGGISIVQEILERDDPTWDALIDPWAQNPKLGELAVAGAYASIGYVREGPRGEARTVYGIRDVSIRPDDAHLSEASAIGRINVNTAAQEILDVVGVPAAVAAWFIDRRRGPDGREGTIDDRPFRTVEALEAAFEEAWLSPDDAATLRLLLSRGALVVHSSRFVARVRGFREAGGELCEIRAHFARDEARVELISWEESWGR